MLAATVYFKSKTITLLSIYIPHPTISIITELSSIINSLPPPIVIVGDFNCHNTLWGSYRNDRPGEKLCQILDDGDLVILNDGRPTRKTSPLQNPSAVDLSICSPSLAPLLSWDIDQHTYCSDHAPIKISFPSFGKTMSPPSLFKYRLNAANWSGFRTK